MASVSTFNGAFSNILTPTSLITDGSLIKGTLQFFETNNASVPLNTSTSERGTLFGGYTLKPGGGSGCVFNDLVTVPGDSYYQSTTLKVSSINDQYSQPGSTGYYKYATVNISEVLSSSSSKQQAVLSDDGTNSVAFDYYFDETTGNPDISVATFNYNIPLTTDPPVSICGVPCLHAGQKVSTPMSVSDVRNAGVYFQPRFPVTYTVTNGATAVQQGVSLTSDTLVEATVGTSFSSRISFTYTVFSTSGQVTFSGDDIDGYVFDNPSYLERQRTLAVNSCNGASPISSRRVTTPALSSLVSLTQFDNAATLDGTLDIQLAAGVYSSYLEPNAYLDYTGIGGPDYTGLTTGARFATFAWSFPNLFIVRDKIYITISGLPTPDPGRESSPMLINGEPMQVYYRYYNPLDPTVASGKFGTVWINGNSKTRPYVGGNPPNYYNTNEMPYGFASWTGSNGTYTFSVDAAHGIPANGSCLLYVMVGFSDALMTNQTIGFSGVTLKSA